MAINSFRIRAYVTNGAVFEWDAAIPNLGYELSSSASGVGPWAPIVSLPQSVTDYLVSKANLPVGHSFFKLVVHNADSSLDSCIIPGVLTGSSGAGVTPIAMDDFGIPRSLKVDSGGNLIVSALVGGASGTGDASAALQGQQIFLANSTLAAVTLLKASVDAVTVKLEDVHIDNAQVANMKSVAVTNHPTDFPSAAANASLAEISLGVAKDTTLATASGRLLPLLKTSDLSLDAGKPRVMVMNPPVDYPDAAALEKLADIDFNGLSIKDAVDSATAAVVLEDTHLLSMADTLDTVLANVESANAKLTVEIAAGITEMSNRLHVDLLPLALDASVASLGPKVDLLLKSSELPKVGGRLDTVVSNLPSDYPNAAAQTTLESILTSVDRLDTTHVAITSPLPSGTNALGSVAVSALPLPPNAATETTALASKNQLLALNAELASTAAGSLKDRLSRLETKLTAIVALLTVTADDVIKYSHTFMSIAPASSVTSGIILPDTSTQTTICVAPEGIQGCRLTVSISLDGVTFYPLHGYELLTALGGKYTTFVLNGSMPYIRLDITNPSTALSIPKLYLGVRGVQ